MAFLVSIENILAIVLLILLGYVLRQKGWFDDSFSGNISKLIMKISLPSSIFVSVLNNLTKQKLFSLSEGLLYGVISVIIGYIAAWLMVKALKIRRGRRGTFINTVVNANTIFIGLPLNLALFGDQSISYFLIYYVLNTVSTWAVGVFFITNDSMEEHPARQAFHWQKLLPPPLIGFLLALVFLLAEIPVPGFIHFALFYTGELVTPLSLIYIGIILSDAGLKSIRFDRDTNWALFGRFIFSPAVMIGLILAGNSFVPLANVEMKTLIIQSAIPALAVMPILANEAKGDVQYATNLVTTSTILFLIVIPVLDYILGFIVP